MIPFDPKHVFGQRVGDYVKYRPGYPTEVLDVLVKDCGLAHDWQAADIGSGAGRLAHPAKFG